MTLLATSPVGRARKGVDEMAQRALSTVVKGYTYLEGPRWHDGRLWVPDSYSHKVFTVTPDGTTEDVATVPTQPSGLG